MSDIIIPKKILFVTRYNQCRGPAAESIVKYLSPTATVFSVGTDPKIVGNNMDDVMSAHLQNMGIIAGSRMCMLIDWILDDIHLFEIHDLDKEGIQHPYAIDYDYPETLHQIATYVQDIIIEDGGNINDILRNIKDKDEHE